MNEKKRISRQNPCDFMKFVDGEQFEGYYLAKMDFTFKGKTETKRLFLDTNGIIQVTNDFAALQCLDTFEGQGVEIMPLPSVSFKGKSFKPMHVDLTGTALTKQDLKDRIEIALNFFKQ